MNEFLERELKVDPAGEGIPLTERELCEWGQVRSADEGADWPGESYEALVERVTSGIFEKFSFFWNFFIFLKNFHFFWNFWNLLKIFFYEIENFQPSMN